MEKNIQKHMSTLSFCLQTLLCVCVCVLFLFLFVVVFCTGVLSLLILSISFLYSYFTSTNKTDLHDITEILSKVALNTYA